MGRILHILIESCAAVAIGVALLFGSGCQVGCALRRPIPASSPVGTCDERIERVVRDTMRIEGIPGLSIAVIDHGELAWARGFGWRNVRDRLPVDTDTQFQAGSISKPTCALAVLLLSAAGKLDLNADVNGYLKGWRLESKYTNGPVTLRQLLCHRAGTVPHGFIGFGESKEPPSLIDILTKRHFMNGPAKVAYPPGSSFRYSGAGYCVVQKAIEDVTGHSFEVVMSQTFLEPLGMVRSHFQQPPPEPEAGNAAHGYSWMKTLVYGGRWGVFPEKAAAGLWTTPQDLARVIVAVQKAYSGEQVGPISPAVAQEFLTPQFDSWAGMGVFLDSQGESRGFFHSGENLGYFASFGAGVSNGRGWIIMSNAQKDRFGPIQKAISKEFGWN